MFPSMAVTSEMLGHSIKNFFILFLLSVYKQEQFDMYFKTVEQDCSPQGKCHGKAGQSKLFKFFLNQKV